MFCIYCKEEKTIEEMAVDKNKSCGHRKYCKKCHNAREKSKRYQDILSYNAKVRLWREENPDKLKQHRLNKYNISNEIYDIMWTNQNGLCKICKVKLDSSIRSTRPCIDHDHNCCSGQKSCGKCVRAILCDDCNVALGKFKDNKESLLEAIHYLEEYNVTSR